MSWYGVFSSFYDASLERLYAPFRARMVERVRGRPRRILDVACGTGQNLPHLVPLLDDGGVVIGLDLDEGMLARARARVSAAGYTGVELHRRDARALADDPALAEPFDLVVVALALTVVPQWETVLLDAWARVRAGGQLLILDVWAPRRTLQTWIVEVMARADLRRRVWTPLEGLALELERVPFPDARPSTFGGELFFAVATKPEGARADERGADGGDPAAGARAP